LIISNALHLFPDVFFQHLTHFEVFGAIDLASALPREFIRGPPTIIRIWELFFEEIGSSDRDPRFAAGGGRRIAARRNCVKMPNPPHF
jgi:hypothetical protein